MFLPTAIVCFDTTSIPIKFTISNYSVGNLVINNPLSNNPYAFSGSISLTRPTLVRLKFDELMINVWIILSPIIFIFLVYIALLVTSFTLTDQYNLVL